MQIISQNNLHGENAEPNLPVSFTGQIFEKSMRWKKQVTSV